LHGAAGAEGKQEQGEEGTGSGRHGGKHHPNGRRPYWIAPFRRALQTALLWPNSQQPQALRVSDRHRYPPMAFPGLMEGLNTDERTGYRGGTGL
jgi:hypothetical protein